MHTFFAIANNHLQSFAITSLKPGLQQKLLADFGIPHFSNLFILYQETWESVSQTAV